MIMKCESCGEYTLRDEHCNEPTKRARPAPMTDSDTKKEYRRRTKLSSR